MKAIRVRYRFPQVALRQSEEKVTDETKRELPAISLLRGLVYFFVMVAAGIVGLCLIQYCYE